MLKCARATFFAAVLCFGFSVSAQPLPCPAGTLANVLGTSCSVGSIIFNFGPDFQAGLTSSFPDQANHSRGDRFYPSTVGSQRRFQTRSQLCRCATRQWFQSFILSGSVTLLKPRLGPRFALRVCPWTLRRKGVLQDGIGFVQAVDEQFYPNSGLLENLAQIDIQQGVSLLNQLSDSHILEVPGFLSLGTRAARSTA